MGVIGLDDLDNSIYLFEPILLVNLYGRILIVLKRSTKMHSPVIGTVCYGGIISDLDVSDQIEVISQVLTSPPPQMEANPVPVIANGTLLRTTLKCARL